MSVYKRGDKGVFYMNFTVGGVRVTRSTGKFTKKEAKLVEAVEKKRMMVDGECCGVRIELLSYRGTAPRRWATIDALANSKISFSRSPATSL